MTGVPGEQKNKSFNEEVPFEKAKLKECPASSNYCEQPGIKGKLDSIKKTFAKGDTQSSKVPLDSDI